VSKSPKCIFFIIFSRITSFIEEPTSPDDILGHATIRQALKPYGIGVATGEHCQNRVMFKQLLQAGSIDICQIDACRLGGVNEVMSVLLMAKKYVISEWARNPRLLTVQIQHARNPSQWGYWFE
jgi:L-alanine-DL-glutamate epimerase-like enolase superfamily enzyme